MTRVLYIAGYGRSGSTALSAVLGNHPDVINAGEVRQLLHEWIQPLRVCSCGQPYDECLFWQELFLDTGQKKSLWHQQRRIEQFASLPHLLAGKNIANEHHAYKNFQQELFTYIREKTKKSIVLDSSKSAWRASGRFLALRRIVGEDVFVIHLVRNGLATMESQVLKGKNSQLENQTNIRGSAISTAFGWGATNLMTSWLRHKLPSNRYLLVRYEDFIVDPTRILSEIGKFAGLDTELLQKRICEGDSFEVGHVVSGNRLRFSNSIKLRRQIRNDYGARLNYRQRAIFNIMDYPLQRRYGYA